MPIVIRMALLTDLFSIWLEAMFPGVAHSLPIPADHVLRLLILLLGSAIILELLEICRHCLKARQHKPVVKGVDSNPPRVRRNSNRTDKVAAAKRLPRVPTKTKKTSTAGVKLQARRRRKL